MKISRQSMKDIFPGVRGILRVSLHDMEGIDVGHKMDKGL